LPEADYGDILGDGAAEEEDEDDGGGDPEGAVEIRVPVEDVEEVCAGVEGDAAAAEDFGGVDVEELGVEGDGPEVAFGGDGGGGGGAEGVGAVGEDFVGAGGVVVEGCGGLSVSKNWGSQRCVESRAWIATGES